MDANDRNPGDAEAAGALAAMAETYGRELSVGDWANFRNWWAAGGICGGRVVRVMQGGFLVNVDGTGALYVHGRDVVGF